MVSDIQPYGSWNSPISSNSLTENTLRFGQIDVDGSSFYYTEGRPSEKGRSVLMKDSLELLPQEFNIRTTVHEYGGKCFLAHKGTVYFVNYKDQDLYKINKEGLISRITEEPSMRFADFSITNNSSFLYAVAEKHSGNQVENILVCISLTTLDITVIASGYDFYAAPRVDHQNRQLTWFCWNHPNMPWDGTELWLGNIQEDGSLSNLTYIAGGEEESITAPLWSQSNVLYFISDRSGFWNIYRYFNGFIEPLHLSEIDFGAPHWIFGSERYCFLNNDTIVAIGTIKGRDSLYLLDTKNHTLELLETPFSSISDLYFLENNSLIFIATSPSTPTALVSFDLKTKQISIIKYSQPTLIEKNLISLPEEISFKTKDDLTSYGFYYPPKNGNIQGEKEETPPLIMRCHSGPTAHCSAKFNLDILYFTSRGFAFFEINYGGSTGYGRNYRNRLRNNWGVVDTQDCIHAATELCKKGLADPHRLIIKGGSAGGYTALNVLTFTNTFQAGACYYGVSDLEALAKDTHKFELHYLDRLIAPYPQGKDTYIKRSPIHSVDKLSCPIIFFQGANDHVVPPSQSETMYLALSKKKIPTAYLLFENESHGFRIGSTIKRCIESELFFYSKIFNFALPSPLPPIQLD